MAWGKTCDMNLRVRKVRNRRTTYTVYDAKIRQVHEQQSIVFLRKKAMSPPVSSYLQLKGTQAWNFFLLFCRNRNHMSQGPVTWDFWKLYSIRPRYLTFNHFRVCSACDEICSSYAQCAIKFVPHMLSMDWTCKNCSHFTAGWPCAEIGSLYAQCAMKSILRMLSMRENCFREYSAGYIFRKILKITKFKCKCWLKIIESLKNSPGTHLIWPKWRIREKKFGSAYAQSPQKCSNIKVLAKIERKEANFFLYLQIVYKDLI